MNDNEDHGGCEPCFAHRLGDGHVVDPASATDVARFRKAERHRLYDLRKAVPSDQRLGMATVISQNLGKEIDSFSGAVVAVYWPIRGELDLRGWMREIHAQGATVALPVIVAHRQPVEFHKWTPTSNMQAGIWRIPVPENAEAVTPNIVIVPLVGVDKNRFRLGNGGGYYDRTLAGMPSATLVIGVGHGFSTMKTIFPMPWDIAMNKVILSDGSIF